MFYYFDCVLLVYLDFPSFYDEITVFEISGCTFCFLHSHVLSIPLRVLHRYAQQHTQSTSDRADLLLAHCKKAQQNEHWHRDIRQRRAHRDHNQLEEIRQRRFYVFTSSKFVHFQVSIKALQAALDMCGYLQLQWICFSSWILGTDLNLAVNTFYLTVWGSLWPSVHRSSEIIPTHVSESIQCNLSHRCMPYRRYVQTSILAIIQTVETIKFVSLIFVSLAFCSFYLFFYMTKWAMSEMSASEQRLTPAACCLLASCSNLCSSSY